MADITGTPGDNSRSGGNDADHMFGLAGNDTLQGFNNRDTLEGGSGNDSLIGGNGGGTGDGGDSLIGGTGSDTLDGSGNRDTLDGGTGADSMFGGGGDDTYVVDDGKDIVSESGFGGIDTVQSSLSFDLNGKLVFGQLENLTLTGSSALSGIGNTLANALTGNIGANTLTGNDGNDTLDGGASADSMIGGAGDDTYVIDNAGDKIFETGVDANDTVISKFSVDLDDPAFSGIEHATLTGTAAINATGSALVNHLIGNDGANKLDGGTGNDTLEGGKGNDIYVVDTAADIVAESLGGAAGGIDTVLSSGMLFQLGANLENLTLVGNAVTGIGNALANKLSGNDLANTFGGFAGDDTMAGGLGDDSYSVEEAGDRVIEAVNAGFDIVVSTIGYTLTANVEGLELFADIGKTADFDGTGNNLDNDIEGSVGNNVLSGLAGNDTLDGGEGNDTLDGGTGADSMFGENGDDVFVFDSFGDHVVEGFNEGIDEIRSSIALAAALQNIENYTFTGTTPVGFAGNDLANRIVGTAKNDTLTGNGGNDTLHGGAGADGLVGGTGDDTVDGGTGADILEGDGGNDSYVIDSAADKIVENAGDLNDRVLAAISVDLNLPAFANIEHATLTGTAALDATGNGGANMLIGNAGTNLLDGKGGNDTAVGGAGNDTYTVDSVSDVAIENPGEGTDTVISTATKYTLGAFIENLTLAGNLGISGTGNALANKITGNLGTNNLLGLDGNDTLIGNDGADTLDGVAGADSMVGGNDKDIYVVDNLGDKILESAAGGSDTVASTITFTLGASLETLVLLGADAVDGTGNTLNNNIQGNSGNNVLIGLAGADTLDGTGGANLALGGDGNDVLAIDIGLDTLVGGAGSDRFAFLDASVTGVDVIADLDGLPGGDKIEVGKLLTGVSAFASDFFQTVTANGSTTIKVDTNGAAGGAAFIDLVVLQGVSTDLDGLLANGTIVIDDVPIVPAASSKDGTAGNDTIFGASNSGLIRGLGGDDSLAVVGVLPPGIEHGAHTLDGGTGADTMAGGGGNDTYVVDNVKDVINELGGDLNDRVLASIAVDLNLAPFANIEHATLTGTAALNATGNGGANMLIGNSGANKLDGKGGDDTAVGGAGNDIYSVDSFTDVAIENPGEGTDIVISSAGAFTLGAFIENLTLDTAAPAGGFGAGNALANVITGNVVGNNLSGAEGNDTLIGNDGNDDLSGDSGADSLVGGKGNDVYRVDDIGDKILESGPASDIDRVISTISFVLGANVENLSLFGDSGIDGTGNALNNGINGNAEANVLSGLAGDDTLAGSEGDDLLLGGDGKDQLFAAGGADTLVGGAGSDKVIFDLFNNSLDGVDVVADFNGLPGGDQLDLFALIQPGKGAESLFIQTVTANGSTTVRVDQDGLGGKFAFVDLAVLQGVSIDFQGLLANGAIAGLATPATPPIDGTAGVDSLNGTPISDLMHGLAGNDSLTGNNGFDTLDGGTGMDTMAGGGGNDTYVVDNVKDVISELGGDLNDRVLASIALDLSLAPFANIEHATLTGAAALNATGNGGANMLIGNSGANVLDGGAGNDTLIGGAGNDTYKVDSAADVAIERPGEGTDTVISKADFYILSPFIENLTLDVGTIGGTGNAQANKITGNAGDNNLEGDAGSDTLIGNDGSDNLNGGTGADSMSGGNGSDNYTVDDVGDKVTESSAAGGTDGVDSFISFTLGANLESLHLLGDAAIDGTGNALDNFLIGSLEANVLSGLAGDDSLNGSTGNDLLLGGVGDDELFAAEGLDTLVGGAGSDKFTFTAFFNSLDGRDVIADFNGDAIDVSALLSGFVEGVSNVNDFLRAVQANGSTTLQVDADGAVGGVAFVDMVVLQGVNTSIGGLLNDGSLLLD